MDITVSLPETVVARIAAMLEDAAIQSAEHAARQSALAFDLRASQPEIAAHRAAEAAEARDASAEAHRAADTLRAALKGAQSQAIQDLLKPL